MIVFTVYAQYYQNRTYRLSDNNMSIDIKLQSLYKSLIEGEYVTKFDALSLSGVDLESSPAEDGATPRTTPSMPGLMKLTEEIEKRLITEGINEQGLLMRINNELMECERAVQQNAVYKFMHSADKPASVDWASLPQAENDILSEEEQQVQLDWIKGRLQDLHAEIMNQLGAKCYVYKKVHGLYETYLKMIVEIAAQTGVRHPSTRAKIMVDAEMNKMLSNKFLATNVLKVAKQKTVQLLTDLIFYGSEGIEYAEHQLNFKSVLQLNERKTNFLDFGVSFRVGCVFMLLLWAVFEVVANELNGKETWLDPSFTIFICIGLFLVLLWCWGISLYVWRNAGINFVTVLGLEGTSLASVRRPEDLVFRSATDLTFVFLLVFILFNSAKTRVFVSDANPWIAHSLPVALLLFFIYRAVNPWGSRKEWFSMVSSMGRSMHVTFRDGYVADILTSLVRVYLSIFFAISYTIGLLYFAFSSEPGAISTVHLSEMDQAVRNNLWFRNLLLPVITLLPLKIRLIQCLLRSIETGNRWPHFGNALKYGTCAIVVAQGLFDREVQHELTWLVSLFFVTMYQFAWDIVMDWGLITVAHSDGSFRIRSNRYIGSNWVYYVAIVVNFVLRFAWILTLIQLDITNTEKEVGDRKDKYVFVFDYLHPVAAALEIFRRMLWGIFRVEFEQIENFGRNCDESAHSFDRHDNANGSKFNADSAPASKFEKVLFIYLC